MTEDPSKTIDFNSLITLVRTTLLKPLNEEVGSDGSITFIRFEPDEVVIQLTGDEVGISVYAIQWEGPHKPVMRPQQLANLNWKRLRAERLTSMLHDLIETAQQIRRARFRTCIRCGETTPPEWMHDKETCQPCAERHLGIIY